jgi:hypothetical protein
MLWDLFGLHGFLLRLQDICDYSGGGQKHRENQGDENEMAGDHGGDVVGECIMTMDLVCSVLSVLYCRVSFVFDASTWGNDVRRPYHSRGLTLCCLFR